MSKICYICKTKTYGSPYKQVIFDDGSIHFCCDSCIKNKKLKDAYGWRKRAIIKGIEDE